MGELHEKTDRGTGEQRRPELLPGYDPDWRSSVQIYPAALELGDLWDLGKYFERQLRLIGHRDTGAFAAMARLADDLSKIKSRISKTTFCDPAEQPVGRAFQAAIKALAAFYFDKRLRATHLDAARIVVLCVHAELYLRDIAQKQRELAAWAVGGRHPSPGAFNIVPDFLALWRGLQIGEFEGRRLEAIADRFGLDRSTIGQVKNVAMPYLQRKFGRYCRGLAIPPQTTRVPCYNDLKDLRRDAPKPALAPPVELPDETFLGAWRAEALEYWGYWGDATKLPQGLAAGCRQANVYGIRDYSSDGVLIQHPQAPANWAQIVALPNGKDKNRLQDQDAAIEALVSDAKRKSAIVDYFTGAHHWKTKEVKRWERANTIALWSAARAGPTLVALLASKIHPRRSASIRSPSFCGPVIEIAGELYPRAVGSKVYRPDNIIEPRNIGPLDVVDRIEITEQSREFASLGPMLC